MLVCWCLVLVFPKESLVLRSRTNVLLVCHRNNQLSFGLQWTSLDFDRFHRISLDFNWFQWISLYFNGFQYIWMDFNRCLWISISLILFESASCVTHSLSLVRDTFNVVYIYIYIHKCYVMYDCSFCLHLWTIVIHNIIDFIVKQHSHTYYVRHICI